MRFARYPVRSKEKREWTPQRLAAAKRKVQAEKDSIPLFPAMARYQTVEDRVADVDDYTRRLFGGMRDHNARQWREARRRLQQMPARTRAGMVRYWNTCGCPGSPDYLLSAIANLDRTGFSPWSQLRRRRQLFLIGQHRLARVHLNESADWYNYDLRDLSHVSTTRSLAMRTRIKLRHSKPNLRPAAGGGAVRKDYGTTPIHS